MNGPYAVTQQLERNLAAYTGAPYVVCLNSGTAAIKLACQWHQPRTTVTLPVKTYCSVPMAVINAGHNVRFEDCIWHGEYALRPLPVWDSARRFTSHMYNGGFQCLSFATNKILGIEQGGAILHPDPEADKWFRRMRFDGRTEGVDPRDEIFNVIADHCIMLPSIAAQLVLKLHHTPLVNADLPDYDYPALDRFLVFR